MLNCIFLFSSFLQILEFDRLGFDWLNGQRGGDVLIVGTALTESVTVRLCVRVDGVAVVVVSGEEGRAGRSGGAGSAGVGGVDRSVVDVRQRLLYGEDVRSGRSVESAVSERIDVGRSVVNVAVRWLVTT